MISGGVDRRCDRKRPAHAAPNGIRRDLKELETVK
jgi:hypothetical protein